MPATTGCTVDRSARIGHRQGAHRGVHHGAARTERQGALDRVHRRAADEPGDEQVLGAFVDGLGRAHLLQATVADDGDAVGNGHRLDLVVGDVDDRGPETAMQVDQLESGLRSELRVQVGQRLVHQEHLGLAHDGPGQGHPLALPTGQLAGLAVQVLGEVERGGGLGDRRARSSGSGAVVLVRHER